MRKLAALLILALAAPLTGGAEAGTPTDCESFVGGRMPGDPVTPPGPPHDVVTGAFDTSLEGAYVLVPFEVPETKAWTRLQLRLCHDGPDLPALAHTLDLGVYEPTIDGAWDADEFRGWGGSSRPEVLLTPQGSNEEPNTGPTDGAHTTVGYLPGDVPPGEWAAEIGVAAVVGPDEGDRDGEVNWRLEIYLGDDPADGDEPWSPAAYDAAPADEPAEPKWYKGDFHVHARHSNPNDVLLSGAFSYAFTPRPDGAGLDFLTLSDYVGTRHWEEIGRFQADGTIPDGKLVIRSAEVITYRGHVNNHGSATWVDYRAGPVYEYRSGTLTPVTGLGGREPHEMFDDVHASGGWTQVNHPTTFPSKVPGFGNLCRGCSWEYSDAETDWSKVDSMEVQTGPAGYTEPKGDEPGPNPFTPLAIEWWDRLRRHGHDITAVGSSDSHRGGDEALTWSPIGEATTVVRAAELSEQGIGAGVRAGHAYVKFFSSDGPDLRVSATPVLGGPEVIMGDPLFAPAAELTAEVFFGTPPQHTSHQPRTLVVLHDGVPSLSFPVAAFPFEVTVPVAGPGDYRLQLHRGTAIEAVTNPITLCPTPIPGDARCTN